MAIFQNSTRVYRILETVALVTALVGLPFAAFQWKSSIDLRVSTVEEDVRKAALTSVPAKVEQGLQKIALATNDNIKAINQEATNIRTLETELRREVGQANTNLNSLIGSTNNAFERRLQADDARITEAEAKFISKMNARILLEASKFRDDLDEISAYRKKLEGLLERMHQVETNFDSLASSLAGQVEDLSSVFDAYSRRTELAFQDQRHTMSGFVLLSNGSDCPDSFTSVGRVLAFIHFEDAERVRKKIQSKNSEFNLADLNPSSEVFSPVFTSDSYPPKVTNKSWDGQIIVACIQN